MEKGNALVALGGDSGNTVPKYDVTPAEIAVLRVIHGDDAVYDIEKTGTVNRTNRAELSRLTEVYGQRQPNGNSAAPAVSALFPGAAARVFESFDELELDESLFKPVRRDAPKAEAKPTQEPAQDGLDSKSVKQLEALAAERGIDLTGKRKKPDIIEAIEAAAASSEPPQGGNDDDEDDDGIGEMNDAGGSSNNVLE
ncbi:Rho termination factor N-terminal domain-containing protein [Agrobacterium tumefaciens]|uniref:Rho termination factor N-terminal domain-containing protein n=1 Tax=Agrobacterium tumefaciens TaxID=358 RepID=UPI0021CEA4E1|nr:Rho termination factor N-terminal domain-containing protein [Agrobacterium tumefaciens]UXS23085.1 hypothetical protein FY153_00955 [Agrobacterium tumefaciens]